MDANKHVGTPAPSITIRREGMYGFWKIIPSRGRLPDSLRGRYTNSTAAILDVEKNLDNVEIKVDYSGS
jgi:hypothetical protein